MPTRSSARKPTTRRWTPRCPSASAAGSAGRKTERMENEWGDVPANPSGNRDLGLAGPGPAGRGRGWDPAKGGRGLRAFRAHQSRGLVYRAVRREETRTGGARGDAGEARVQTVRL